MVRRRYAAAVTDAAAQPEEQDDVLDPLPCPPCRGTGRVVSKLGGEAHELACPWCEGTGTVIPGHDAQAARREDGAGRTS
jgi:DnaJ-class molecular chaperone